jgi:hypothetical protein
MSTTTILLIVGGAYLLLGKGSGTSTSPTVVNGVNPNEVNSLLGQLSQLVKNMTTNAPKPTPSGGGLPSAGGGTGGGGTLSAQQSQAILSGIQQQAVNDAYKGTVSTLPSQQSNQLLTDGAQMPTDPFATGLSSVDYTDPAGDAYQALDIAQGSNSPVDTIDDSSSDYLAPVSVDPYSIPPTTYDDTTDYSSYSDDSSYGDAGLADSAYSDPGYDPYQQDIPYGGDGSIIDGGYDGSDFGDSYAPY